MNVKVHLGSMSLEKIIAKDNDATSQNHPKTMISLYHHLDEVLKTKYLMVKKPLDLWNNLKERFNHMKLVILSKARYD